MRLGIERRVLVHLDDPDVVVLEVLFDPIGFDQHVVCVVGHLAASDLVPLNG
jgi:hypothetical protein